MSPALLTIGQSRWALHVLIGLLALVAICSSAPSSAGGVTMLGGRPGDIRGPAVLMGGVSLGSVLIIRAGTLLLPKPWRIYLDRLEFAVFGMLWVSWTSATMAFSAFTVTEGVCSPNISELYLPTCRLLTFDLVLFHLLSISTLALLLVIVSAALSPSYYRSLSLSADGSATEEDPDAAGVFVMWELAIASAPSSPRLEPVAGPSAALSYGTNAPTTPSRPEKSTDASQVIVDTAPKVKRDKFAEGRVWSYAPLLLCSLGTMGAAILMIVKSRYVATSAFMLVVSDVTIAFSCGFLIRHYRQRNSSKTKQSDSFMLRHDRAMEVGLAGALFLLWPLSAIIYTLFPPTPNRPCSNPAASLESPEDLPDESKSLCLATMALVTLGWVASWLILARVLGLLFPMPELGAVFERKDDEPSSSGAETQRLLAPQAQSESTRPQVKWGRLVAGEAFELGDEDD